MADSGNHRIRKINAVTGATTTLAGNGTRGFVDGTGGASGTSRFWFPAGVAVDSTGNVYIADTGNARIRKIDSVTGATTTVTGNGTYGFVDGTGGPTGTTQFSNPSGVAVDAAGNLYVADGRNARIRKVVGATGATSTLAGNGTAGFVDGTGGLSGSAQFVFPFGIAVDGTGNVYVADFDDSRIRKIEGTRPPVAPVVTTTTVATTSTTTTTTTTITPTTTIALVFPTIPQATTPSTSPPTPTQPPVATTQTSALPVAPSTTTPSAPSTTKPTPSAPPTPSTAVAPVEPGPAVAIDASPTFAG